MNGNIEEINLEDHFNRAIIYHTLEHVMNAHRTLEQTIRFFTLGRRSSWKALIRRPLGTEPI
ncbi:MAG: hypothetical protein ACETWT_11825 [Thermodesulfobacteriota bacterium]